MNNPRLHISFVLIIIYAETKDHTFLFQDPVPKLFRAGFFTFNQDFPSQGFLFEVLKGFLHPGQAVDWETERFLYFVNGIAQP